MDQYTTTLYNQMEKGLQETAIVPQRPMEKAKASFEIAEGIMEQLKEFIRGYTFADRMEEIRFFKSIKPKFHRYLIYFSELIYIEAEQPAADRRNRIAFYKLQIARNLSFIARYKSLHTYVRLGNDAEDEILFLREHGGQHVYPEYGGDIDRSFSTLSSSNLAKLQAFDMVNKYLSKQIDEVKQHRHSGVAPQQKATTLVWTDSKADLVELAYALYSKGSLNHGKVNIKDIIGTLENTFDIRIGNFYRIYTDLSLRKKSRTPYTDSMKEYLERRMDSTL
ncbi:RteC domain-containing protein [Sphingobacterium sp. KU25419]|nr:RteC domain-containing protein [Sphingobacterium sp. KU25419]